MSFYTEMRSTFLVAALLTSAVTLVGCHRKPQQATTEPSLGQFDIQCDGYRQKLGPNGMASKETFSAHFKVDLKQNLWCGDKCESILRIKKVEPGEIVFVDTVKHDGKQPNDGVRISVNRVTGQLVDVMSIGQNLSMTNATCVRAPYSHLPVTRF